MQGEAKDLVGELLQVTETTRVTNIYLDCNLTPPPSVVFEHVGDVRLTPIVESRSYRLDLYSLHLILNARSGLVPSWEQEWLRAFRVRFQANESWHAAPRDTKTHVVYDI